MRYRRADVKGGTYFFTVNLAQRHLRLLLDHVDILRTAVKTVKQRHPFHIDAFVVLPDHLHAIWTLPPDDADFATRWMLIKSGFSRKITIHKRRNLRPGQLKIQVKIEVVNKRAIRITKLM